MMPWILASYGLPNAGAGELRTGCDIVKVYDGDTVTAICSGEKVKIRFYCIDTPEMQQKPWGIRSRDHLRNLIDNSGRISIRAITKDRYKRTVAELIDERGHSINLRMVEDGMAAVYGKYCPVAGFKTAEAAAKSLYRGLWSQPGLHQTPWKWRELKRNRNKE